MKKLILFTLFTFSNVLFSQNYELGKVTVDELKETEHKIEKDAVASKIFSIAKTKIIYSQSNGFQLVTEVETKIKIYKVEGLEYANFSISYYNNDNDKEIVNISDAVTYNLENNKILKSKLKNEGEFTEKVNKYNNVKKITMPNVKVGSIVEFKYTLKSPFLSRINDWYFQDLIPVDYSFYQLKSPEYYTYNAVYKGDLLVKQSKSTARVNLSFTEKERVGGKNGLSTEFSESKLSYNENIVNYELFNVPSISGESFVKNISNYISSVSHELASIQYPNEPFKLLSTSWEEVARTINSSENFGGELNKKGFFEEDIDKLISGKSSDEEKIVAIYDFVKNNFKWNGYYGIYTEEGLRSVYKNKTGNVADINLMLTAFLRHAGLNSHPVLISSVSNGIPSFPSRTGFNYVIAGVEYNGNTILLDATDKNSLPNILPSRAINWIGRMIYQNGGSKEVDLQPNVISKDNIILNYTILEDGKTNGNLKRQLTNYNAYSYRNNYGSMSKESIIEILEKKYDNIEIDNYLNENTQNLDLPIKESFDFTDSKHIEIIGDKIYFSPMLFFGLESNPFKKETRSYPIEFPFPYSDKYAVKITIPDGYIIESLPQNENLVFGEKFLTHKFIVTQEANSINLSLQEDVNTMILSAEYYNDLKEYFQKIVNKQTEKIVLKKK